MEVDKFRQELITHDARLLFRKYFLSSSYWLFETYQKLPNHNKVFDEFKLFIAESLGVHPANIAVIGSSKLGFSLAPEAEFRAFRDQSDIDIVVVSPELFESSWNAYYELSNMKYVKGYSQIASNVFNNFVSLKKVDPDVEFFKNWEKRTGTFVRDLQLKFSIQHQINYRIYKSWDWVEKYHIRGIEELQSKLEGEK